MAGLVRAVARAWQGGFLPRCAAFKDGVGINKKFTRAGDQRALMAVAAFGEPLIEFLEQNATMALELADRAYVLRNGAVNVSGPAPALRADRAIREAYLGLAS